MSILAKTLQKLAQPPTPALERLSYGRAFRHAAATPLTNLLLSLAMIEQHRALQKSAYLRQAVESAQHLKQLFQLDGSSQPSKQIESFSVKLAIEAAIRLVKPLQKQVLVRSHFAFDQNLTLKGNRFCFQEAVICTLKNAIESYRPMKTVRNRVVLVTGRRQKLANDQLGLKLAFIDGGCGLGWWQRPLVFAEGYTTKSQGTGFGLVWIKQVVEKHFKGEVKLKSHKNHGTTLTWLLPLSVSSKK